MADYGIIIIVKCVPKIKFSGEIMNFEEQVKAIKEKCRAGAGNKDFRLTKDETDILILAFQAGDRDAGQCLYDCLQGYMISVAINNGRSLMYEGHREEFLMTCQEVFFKCIDKYDCGQEARFEAYLSKAILNECVTACLRGAAGLGKRWTFPASA